MNEQLQQFLDRASLAYFEGHPIISDDQFDRLADSCGYNKVGYTATDTEKHAFQMYSLQKWYSDSNKPNPLATVDGSIVKTPKLDGAAVSLLYIERQFVRALTRGDGREGKDITDKLKTLVPKTIGFGHNVTQIVGEVVAPKTVENSRNYAAGSLNLNSLEEFKTRTLQFVAYSVYPYLTPHYTTDLDQLTNSGFLTVLTATNLEFTYPTDGVVFRVNSNKTFEHLGYTSKHPRGSYAEKVRQEGVETTLLSVEWQVGKTGKVTPVAILEPVLVGDAQVTRATLNNPGFIQALDLDIGDRVLVRRAGEVIPEIVSKV
jgi:DNA ligase (NAD+)